MAIAPSNRLLFWFALIVLPFVLVGTINPHLWGLCLSVVGGLLLLAAGDAVTGRERLKRLDVSAPAVIRSSERRDVNLPLTLINQSRKQFAVRVGAALPEGVRAATDILEAVLPEAAELSQADFMLCAERRGKYLISAVYIESESALKMWRHRKRVACETEIRIYPSLVEEGNRVSGLFLNRGNYGLHAQRQMGRGREFERLRDYVPGDTYEEIYWKATARRGHPVTKVFQIERTQEVYVIVDASRSSARSQPVAENGLDNALPLLDRYIKAALILGLAAERQGDLFGLITFSDRVHDFLKARNGKTHYGLCRDALYTLQPNMVTPDFSELFTFIRLHLRRRALLIFLTNLDDRILQDEFQKDADLICRHHLVMVNMVRPAMCQPLFTTVPETERDLYGQIAAHMRWQDLQELSSSLRKHGVHLAVVDSAALSAEAVERYMNVKKRQLV